MVNKSKRLVFFFLYNLCFVVGFGQNKFSDDLSISANYKQGFVLPEYEFINYLVYDYTRSFELSLLKETSGKTEWEQVYSYPSYGISFFYSSLGNDEVFGHEMAIYPFFRINLFQKGAFKLYSQTGLGFSYVSKHFDLEENYLNVAVGSHFNIHFNQRLGLSYPLSDKFDLGLGISFDHFSNANTSEPNLGLNYLSSFFGVNYWLGERTEKKSHETKDHERKVENELVFHIGGKHSRALSSKYYQTASLSFEKRKAYWRAFHLGIGADIFYDSSIEDQLLGMEKDYRKKDDFQSGIHISQSFVYNRFSISLQEGIYLGLVEKIDNYTMYNRGIFKYWLNDKVSLRLTMKSHLHILDYPEFGVGIKL